MSKKKDFYRDLAMSESSNNPKTINSKGYIGLYQMGEAALVDTGYYHAKFCKLGQKEGAQYNNGWLNALLSNTASMMSDASNDQDIQQFIQSLGNHSEFNSEDHL